MTAEKLASNVEYYRMHSPAAGDLRPLPIGTFATRWNLFAKHHKREQEIRLNLARIGARF